MVKKEVKKKNLLLPILLMILPFIFLFIGIWFRFIPSQDVIDYYRCSDMNEIYYKYYNSVLQANCGNYNSINSIVRSNIAFSLFIILSPSEIIGINIIRKQLKNRKK